LIYKDLQLYVRSIGDIVLVKKGKREILVVLLVDNEVNIGVLILQMRKFSVKIKQAITRSQAVMDKLQMIEGELIRLNVRMQDRKMELILLGNAYLKFKIHTI